METLDWDGMRASRAWLDEVVCTWVYVACACAAGDCVNSIRGQGMIMF